MKQENLPPLGSKGSRLLSFLVQEIAEHRIRKGEPQTFIAYSEALVGMGISQRGRAGQQLQREGLNELNEWTLQNPELPKIASLIVNKRSRRPSQGFAISHGITGDWDKWWLAEAARAIDFDWLPYLCENRPKDGRGSPVREEEGVQPDYRAIITMEPGKRGGRPCIRGMRITVADILGWLAADMTAAEIIDDFPELTSSDIRAALEFAADRERHTVSVALHA